MNFFYYMQILVEILLYMLENMKILSLEILLCMKKSYN